MVQSYLFPISYAFMAFPLAALLFTLPFLIVQYRRHGYIHKTRALILYLLLLYLMNAFFLVLMPLPASRHNLPPSAAAIQYIPFQFVQDIINHSTVSSDDPSTYWSLLREPALLQVLFNMVLTVPFGMFLSYYFRTRWVVCILLAFGLSLSFEVTQITAIFGFYDYAYRIFDVDDLITNTLGAIIGYKIASWISALLPRIEQLDSHVDRSAKRVTFTRRGLAFLIDGALCLGGIALLSFWPVHITYWLITGLYYMLIPALAHGQTPGKWMVRIRVAAGNGKRLSLWALMIRYGLLYWVVMGLHVLLTPTVLHHLPSLVNWTLQVLVLGTDLWFLSHCLRHILKKDRLLFYERASHTSHVIAWPERPKISTGSMDQQIDA